MTNLEYLQSLEPAQLSAWFQMESVEVRCNEFQEIAEEYAKLLNNASDTIEKLIAACESYESAYKHMASAVAHYRELFEVLEDEA